MKYTNGRGVWNTKFTKARERRFVGNTPLAKRVSPQGLPERSKGPCSAYYTIIIGR